MEKEKWDDLSLVIKNKIGKCVSTGKKVDLPGEPSFLIILMGSLGDVTRGLCLVSRIKKIFPNSSITWLVEPKCREVVALHPSIDNILVFDRSCWKKGLKRIARELLKREFDCTLDLQRHFKSGLFSFLSRARYRIGFHPANSKEGNWVFNNIHLPHMDEFYPKIDHYLKFTEQLGLPSLKGESLDFGLSWQGFNASASTVLSRVKYPFIAIVLGSTWVSKEWSFNGYLRLSKDLLEETEHNIVLVDTMAKYEMACKLENSIQSGRLINLVGSTTIAGLAAVLKSAQAAVGPDCGSAHVASAVGTPYVTLFGPTSWERTAPYGSEHLVVSKNVPCAPCYQRECPGKGSLCMESIEPKDVKHKIKELLNEDC